MVEEGDVDRRRRLPQLPGQLQVGRAWGRVARGMVVAYNKAHKAWWFAAAFAAPTWEQQLGSSYAGRMPSFSILSAPALGCFSNGVVPSWITIDSLLFAGCKFAMLSKAFRDVARLTFLGVFFASWSIGAPQSASGTLPKRVLFIGNSYTYVNNLPAVLAKLADGTSGPKIETKMVVHGGWTLGQLWDAGEALAALREGKWDYVVLQEQSDLGTPCYINGISRISTDAAFQPSAEKWATEVHKDGGTPIFYLTWAKEAAPEEQVFLNYAYAAAAKNAHALLAPVGVAWDDVRRRRPGLELFFSDGSHPSPAGTYLAACVFYAAISGQSPVGLATSTYESKPGASGKADSLHPSSVELPPDEAAFLQATAWATWRKLQAAGGLPEGVPPTAPAMPPPAVGGPLAAAELPGTWSGKLRLLPAPFLPMDMDLVLHEVDGVWRGHVDLKFHSKRIMDQSIELDSLAVTQGEFSFAASVSVAKDDPKIKVHFRGVSTGNDELSGNADADLDPGSAHGTWHLVRTK